MDGVPGASKVQLTSKDGQKCTVDVLVANHAPTLQTMIQARQEDFPAAAAAGEAVSLPALDIAGDILGLAMAYCEKHVNLPEDEAQIWDSQFVGSLDKTDVFDLMAAGYHLRIRGLMDLTAKAVAEHVKGMTEQEMVAALNPQGPEQLPVDDMEEGGDAH